MPSRTFPLLKQPVHDMVLGPNAKHLAILGRDEWSIWDVATEQQQVSFPLPWEKERLRFQGLAASVNGDYFIAAGGRRIRICDFRSRTVAEGDLRAGILSVGVSPNGSVLAVLDETGHLRLFHQNDLEQLIFSRAAAVPFAIGKPCTFFAFSSDGQRLVVVSAESGLQFDVIDVATGEMVRSLRVPGIMPMHVAISRDGSSVIAIVLLEKPFSAVVWDLQTGQLKQKLQVAGPGQGVSDLALSPYGEYWAGIQDHGQKIDLQVLSSGEKVALGSNLGHRMVFGVDGKHIAAWSFARDLQIWSLDSLEMI